MEKKNHQIHNKIKIEEMGLTNLTTNKNKISKTNKFATNSKLKENGGYRIDGVLATNTTNTLTPITANTATTNTTNTTAATTNVATTRPDPLRGGGFEST